ncbi:YIP1 family protein [Ureibacillus sp. FSL K6-8385]|uniref:YIP1 family protein n=1 Tax=Ureibacillus terrenus TaxID=118246 RepID=A0A540V4V3_9BACL|nr:YIP1 family protein [Ureibacillus terrenus]MED3661525.1 YIP1 family protein [Ureibacillus terrenus]TQE91787.1 YIP1 family protein [Ureibacillus terrenus]
MNETKETNEVIEAATIEKVNPFLSVWMHPKKTARYVVQEKSLLFVFLILYLGYFGTFFSSYDPEIFPEIPIWALILISVIASPFIAVISNAFSALGIWLFGKLFAGKGTYQQIFKAIALSALPSIVLIPIYLLWFLIDSNSFLYPGEGFSFFSILSNLAIFVTSIWAIVISIAAIAEIHQFSNWKAFFTLLLFTIVVGLIIGFIAIIMVFLIGIALFI